jgi:hypothetical protein
VHKNIAKCDYKQMLSSRRSETGRMMPRSRITVHDGGGEARFETIPEQAAIVGDIFNGLDRNAARSERFVVVFKDPAKSPRPENTLVSADRMAHPSESAVSGDSCGPQESRRALSDLLFQPIIVMQSTEDRLGSDAATDGKLMPMAACRNIRLDGFRCTRA